METLKWLYGPIQNFIDSFKISDGGFSLRKEIAVATMVMFIYGNYKIFSNPVFSQMYITVLFIDAGFIGLCVGLVTFAELVKFKNGDNSTSKPTTNTPDEATV